MSGKQQGGLYHYVDDEHGFQWSDDGKYKNMIDIGTMWYARLGFILFIITIIVVIVMFCKVDGDVQALKQAIINKKLAFYGIQKPAAPTA